MTPLEIDILLWYHTRAVDYRDGDLTAPAVREAIDRFRGPLELLAPLPEERGINGDRRTYQLTERGRVYVEALQDLPLPVKHWIIPAP